MPTLNFDASQVSPSSGFDPLPAGKYLAEITDTTLKPTRKGDGKYLEIEFTVMNGEFKGRKVWDRLCLHHPNMQTVEIAKSNLSAICHAVGVLKPNDSMELHHRPLNITVKCRADKATDEIFNEIKGYAKPDSRMKPSEPQPAEKTQETVAPQEESNMPPWSR